MEIKFSKDFLLNLEKILKNNKNISVKIEQIIFDNIFIRKWKKDYKKYR